MSEKKKEEQKKYQVKLMEIDGLKPEEAVVYASLDAIPKLAELLGEEKVKYIGKIAFEVHNPFVKDGDTDYIQYVFITDKGAYVTGSESFNSSIEQLIGIRTALGVTGDFYFRVVEKESKNNVGKMLLCMGVTA